MCDRSIHVHGFQCDATLFFRREEFQCPHIVNAVCQLDDHHANVMGHCQQDFPNIFCLLLLFVKYGNSVQLGHTVHQHCHVLPEFLANIVQRIIRILYYIVQQSHTNSIGIHAQIQQNICNSQRVNDIWFSGRPLLISMGFFCQLVRRENFT